MPQVNFVEVMLVSELVDERQVQHAQDTLCAAGIEVTTDALAEQMVELGYLTSYQATQLKLGRTKITLGPYVVKDWIGQGGMGQVFKAEHSVMGRECAVKVLAAAKATPSAIRSFQHEIKTQAKLDHPNLVHAYDAGHDGDVHYLVTEYVPGEDLRKLVRSQGPLNTRQAANVFMQVALGLAHAHENQLIHRDIKPGNILVTPDGVAKLSDLGLSSVAGMADPNHGKIVGTADYLSPEQIRNPHEISSISDIYSLGCTVYYAVTGKVPYPGGSTRDKIKRHLDLSITVMHPHTFNPNVSEEFVELIADMMEKDPAQRIQTVAEIIKRLEPWNAQAQQSQFPQMGLPKSPWTPPPVFSDDQDTNVGDYGDFDSTRNAQASSAATDPSIAGLQDTHSSSRRLPFPPSPHGVEAPPVATSRKRISRGVGVAIALAVAIPLSMMIGALLTVALQMILHRIQ